jgi:ABC-type nitrate/sulfonate/bicarbonate transport system substrate-binding protein
MIGRASAGICIALGIMASAMSFASAEPVTIRLGNTTTAGEGQIWLMKAMPEIAPGQGKDYILETNPFRGGDIRMKAFQAGQIDGVVSTGTGAITAATKGVPLVVVAALSQEDNNVFSSPYVVLDDSSIRTPADLKGKTIGLNSLREAFELGARLSLLDHGLNPDRDVKWAVIQPAMLGEALRAGKIHMAGIAQPFFATEQKRGNVRVLFTIETSFGVKDEFLVYFNPTFVQQNKKAMSSFIKDLRAATVFYTNRNKEAREAISRAKLIEMEPEVYFNLIELKRKEGSLPSLDYLRSLQQSLIRAGYIDKKIDIESIIDTTLAD